LVSILGKSLKEYSPIVIFPILALIIIMSIDLIILNSNDIVILLIGLLSTLILMFIPFYIGWNCVKKHKFKIKQSAVAGAIYGVVWVLIGYVLPYLFNQNYVVKVWSGDVILEAIIKIISYSMGYGIASAIGAYIAKA
jgi:ABC-type anion transport system duplicated permease subunit